MEMREVPGITPDPMMDELNAIKDAIYEEIKGLTGEERIAYFNARAQEAAELMGWDLVPDPELPGVSKIVPRASLPKAS